MKISTLRLPTGEFAVVVSGSDRPSEATKAGFSDFRRQIGAAGLLITDQEVELEDATVDSDVVRREEAVKADLSPSGFQVLGQGGDLIASIEPGGDAFFRGTPETQAERSLAYLQTHFPRARLTGTEMSEFKGDSPVVSLTFTAEPALIEQATGISPAGLVEGVKSSVDPHELTYGGEPGSDPEPEGVLDDSDWESKPYEPAIGDRVRIVTVNGACNKDSEFNGALGTIIRIAEGYGYQAADCFVVHRDGTSGEHFGDNIYCTEVEPAPLPERKIEVGERVRITSGFYNGDTSFVVGLVGVLNQIEENRGGSGRTCYLVKPDFERYVRTAAKVELA